MPHMFARLKDGPSHVRFVFKPSDNEFSSRQVLSIEKAESTNLLPNPVIVSVRTKKAFQLIELSDREQLVESLNCRLRATQWRQSMFRGRKDGKRSVVRVLTPA